MNPKKYLDSDNYTSIVNYDWIKLQLLKMYNVNETKRPLVISENNSEYTKLGYIMFALEGSPPKGFAVYQPTHQTLLLCNAWMNKTKLYNHIRIINGGD